MSIDINGAIIATIFVFVGGHLITYLVQRGEDKQWRKDAEDKMKDMQIAIDKFHKIDTSQQLVAQKVDKLIEMFQDHVRTDEREFEKLGEKIDNLGKQVLNAVVEITKK
jgi:hypothetical protein